MSNTNLSITDVGKVFILDTESSGGKNCENRIIQIAYTEIDALEIEEGIQPHDIQRNDVTTLDINPECKIQPYLTRNVHHISNADVAHCPKFPVVLEQLVSDIPYGSTIVAHGANSDMRMLYIECLRTDSMAVEWFNSLKSVDSLAIAKKNIIGTKHNLSAVAETLGVTVEAQDVHTAHGDVLSLARIWIRMSNKDFILLPCHLKTAPQSIKQRSIEQDVRINPQQDLDLTWCSNRS